MNYKTKIACSKYAGTSLILKALILLVIPQCVCEEFDCSRQTTCADCMSAGPDCVWCKMNSVTFGHRCDSLKNIQSRNCIAADIVNPDTYIRVQETSSTSNSAMKQLKPHKVTLKLRPNSPKNFSVTFTEIQDYPMDLYYLMDLSNTMKDDKESLANLGHRIGNTLKSITKDFRLGFGSFVDKTVAPFTDNATLATCLYCKSPYNFKHSMKLSSDIQSFVNKVNSSRISGNCDPDEGTLDAMMQAIVCPQIGWRHSARKILLVATDDRYHIAGDGKLGGIVVPNDAACHLNEDGEYMGLIQDYPSISQISNKVKENNITVIFAVTENVIPEYTLLSQGSLLEGSQVVKLAQNSSNIVSLVAEQYKKIVSRLELKDNSPSNIKVEYYSECSGSSRKYQKSRFCGNIGVGKTVEFKIEIEAVSCPMNTSDTRQTFSISPVGLSEEVIVDLEVICNCECGSQSEKSSSSCNNYGTLQCGKCQCDPGRSGEFCQCDRNTAIGKDEKDDKPCKMDNSSLVCSGRGTCMCGVCSCQSNSDMSNNKHIYGSYCECDNFNCPFHTGLPCGGPNHGKCDCGHCKCLPPWSGPACDCLSSQDTCRSSNQEICNGRGICECGRCNCIPPYVGELCEEVFSPGGMCLEYFSYVQCHRSLNKTNNNGVCDSCDNCTFDIVTHLDNTDIYVGQHKCSFKDEAGCNINFMVSLSEPYRIVVQEKQECQALVNIPLVIGSLIGIIVAIGIVLLILLKIVTTLHDNREYAKFKNEVANAKFGMGVNPLFVKPTSRFSNPIFWRKLETNQQTFSK